jgi:hypothetical protein
MTITPTLTNKSQNKAKFYIILLELIEIFFYIFLDDPIALRFYIF